MRFRTVLAFGAGACAATFGGYLANGGRLQAQAMQHVQAPFAVIDANGSPILEVHETPFREVVVRNAGRKQVVRLSAVGEGGNISVQSTGEREAAISAGAITGLHVYRNGKLQARMTSEEDGGALTVSGIGGDKLLYVHSTTKPEDGRVTIGNTERGAFGVRVFTASNTVAAAMGEAKNGGGAVAAYDAKGTARVILNGTEAQAGVGNAAGVIVARMSAADGKGALLISNSAGTGVGAFTIEKGGGGLLELGDPAGDRQAVMGVSGDGAGHSCVIVPARGPTCLGATAPGIMVGR